MLSIREKYTVKRTTIEHERPYGDTLRCEVFQNDEDGASRKIGEYERHYSAFFDTFHPFTQPDGSEYALISDDYRRTAVLKLPECEIIAAEEPHTLGFCPVSFYVPTGFYVGPNRRGLFGFVGGCIWGDEQTMKVQYLNLSQIKRGVLIRSDILRVEIPSAYGRFRLEEHLEIVMEEVDAGYTFVQCHVSDLCNLSTTLAERLRTDHILTTERVHYSGDPDPDDPEPNGAARETAVGSLGKPRPRHPGDRHCYSRPYRRMLRVYDGFSRRQRWLAIPGLVAFLLIAIMHLTSRTWALASLFTIWPLVFGWVGFMSIGLLLTTLRDLEFIRSRSTRIAWAVTLAFVAGALIFTGAAVYLFIATVRYALHP